MISNNRQQTAISTIVEEFSTLRDDYDMSKNSRFVRQRVGLAPSGGSADYHYRSEAKYYNDIEKARDLDRNDSVIGQAVDRAVDNIVQDGFSIDPQTGDAKLDAELLARWNEWANDSTKCDVEGISTWRELESLAMRSTLVDGDCVFLGLTDGAVQMLEAHNIQTSYQQPGTFLGVTRDSYGKPIQYWVQRDGSTPTDKKEASKPYPVSTDGIRTLFHVFRPRRKSMTRGVTAFAPVFQLAGMLDDVQFAKLVQQQIASCFAIFFEQSAQAVLAGGLPSTVGYSSQSTETTSTGQERQLDEVSPGMQIQGRPGETIKGFSPNIPNAEFFPHVRLLLQLIGVNLGLPVATVLMDASETNFSGWRGAVDEARKGFRKNQQTLKDRLHTPLWRWKVSQWIASDPAISSIVSRRKKIDPFGHKWNVPRWAYIDPYKDATADALRLGTALTSPRRLHAERGADWQDLAKEIVADHVQAIEIAKTAAAELNKRFPDDEPIHWRELMPLQLPAKIQGSLTDLQQGAAFNE